MLTKKDELRFAEEIRERYNDIEKYASLREAEIDKFFGWILATSIFSGERDITCVSGKNLDQFIVTTEGNEYQPDYYTNVLDILESTAQIFNELGKDAIYKKISGQGVFSVKL